MKLKEYIENAKKELDEMEKLFLEMSVKEGWPLEMEDGEWGEQELAIRFN